jgi:ATP-binding cassette subfamily B protein
MEGAERTITKVGAKRAGSRNLGHLRRLGSYLRPYRRQVLGILAALVVASAAVLVLGVGARYLIDGAFAEGHPDALDHALKAALIVVAILAVATFARAYLVTRLGERVVTDLRRDV